MTEDFDAFYQRRSDGWSVGIYPSAATSLRLRLRPRGVCPGRDRRRTIDTDQAPEACAHRRLPGSRWLDGAKSAGLQPPDRALLAQRPAGPDVTRVAVSRALQKLPADQRRALVLYHLCDLSVNEIADEVNAPVGTVKARLSRGRAALALLLGDTEVAPHA
jgi:RNA polymerase sigma-70 factor (ECF subfamily)